MGTNAKLIESGGVDLSKAKITSGNLTAKKGSTVNVTNQGVSPDLLTQLVNTFTQPSAAQVSEATPVVVTTSAPASTGDSQPATATDTAASVLSDSINKNPKVWLALAVILGVLLFFYFFRKKS